MSEKPSIVVDLRCLQDPNYAQRGVGRHALGILRHAPGDWHLVGLTDPGLPALLADARQAVETVHINSYATSAAAAPPLPPAGFVMLSPMTHDPIFPARLLTDGNLLRAAVVYDFIPHRFPERYLPGQVERLGYAMALRWLARCDLFAPISRSSADDLAALLGVPERSIVVTGCPLDPAFEDASSRASSHRHLLVVGGGDPRKNPEVVIRAHARSSAMQRGAGIPLVVAGSYTEANARAFRAVAKAAGGRTDLVQVPGPLSDSALVALYGQALALVSASYDEGFSIPLIEGMAAGVPCLASDIPAHAELVADLDCRFPADDDAVLCAMLERMAFDTGWRTALRCGAPAARQARARCAAPLPAARCHAVAAAARPLRRCRLHCRYLRGAGTAG
jgi:glycosyltransferase involved in cell wall biosynthesis